MTLVEFIQNVLITKIGDIVGQHKYLSYGVVSQGIELLGACLDEHEFSKKHESRSRFDLAIKTLFNKGYQEF